MTEPLASWLALREPADHAARSEMLTRRIAATFDDRQPLRVVDLGAGTGSNRRYLSSRLPPSQHWLLVDRDLQLLAEAQRSPACAGLVDVRVMDLGSDPSLDVCAGCRLVTASALLDLVSERWLQALAARCRTERAAVLFALTYDGRFECAPPEPEDDRIRGLLNDHQRRSDKGFGIAAGPAASWCAERAFVDAGYHVELAASDWNLRPEAQELQRRLVQGWADAATELDPPAAPLIAAWLARRLAHVDDGRSSITVGHQDLVGWLR
jgi:hypothetical protein